jgi:hypothetical protein
MKGQINYCYYYYLNILNVIEYHGQVVMTPAVNLFISFCSLAYDRAIASVRANSPQSVI